MNLNEIVQEITIEQFGIKPEDYASDKCFADLGADSLDVVELFMAVEDRLGIDALPDEANHEIDTPDELVAYIQENVLAASA